MNPQTPLLANRRTRVAAFLVDHILLSFIFAAVVFLSLKPNFIEGKIGDGMTTAFPFLAFLVIGIYFAKDSINGASPGKWLLGLRVRDAENLDETPSLVRLFLRNLFLVIWPVEFVVLAISSKKKRLGDTVAKAIVVFVAQKPKMTIQLTAILVVATAFVTFILFFVGAVLKSSDSYKVAIGTIEYDQQIRNETGGIRGYGMIPAGNVNVSDGVGQAQYEIKVLGNKKDMKVWVVLEKEAGGGWRVIGLQK